MRKLIFTLSLFASLFFVSSILTPLAMAQGWKLNQVTNKTNRTVYVVFSTWRPAKQAIPAGHRITGHYPLLPNQTHKFYAFNYNAFYLQIWHPDLEVIKPTADAKTFSAPVITDPFQMVRAKEISASGTNTVLYQRPLNRTYPLEGGFLKYENTGTPISITPAWVRLAAVPEEVTDGGRPDGTTDRPTDTTADRSISDFSIGISPSPNDTTLEPGDELNFTVSLDGDGAKDDIELSISVDPASAGTLTNGSGKTGAQGEFSDRLTLESDYKGNFDIVVIATLEGKQITERFDFTSGLLSGSLEVSGDFNLKAGDSGTLNVAARSQGGQPLADVTVRLSTSSTHILLNRTSGKTDSFGNFSTSVSAISPGSANISVSVDEHTDLSESVYISVGDAIPGTLLVDSFSDTINEGSDVTISARLQSESGTPVAGSTVRFEAVGSDISFSSTSATTDSSGRVSSTLQAGNIASTSQSATFYVRVDGHSDLTKNFTVTVNQVPGTLEVSKVATVTHGVTSVPTSLKSGDTVNLKAIVKSKGGHLMSGVTVNFHSGSASIIAFSSTSPTTNSSGEATSTLKTKSYGDGSFIVTVPGHASKSYSLTVRRYTAPFAEITYSVVVMFTPCGPAAWSDWYRDIVVPEGPVAGTPTITTTLPYPAFDTGKIEFRYVGIGATPSTIRVYGRVKDCQDVTRDIDLTINGNYYVSASSFAAPSLPHLQGHSDPTELSMIWKELSEIPSETMLLANYPNPFNPETWIPYRLSESADVVLSIYSLEGRLVRRLALGHQAAGVYESKSRAAYWDGRNSVGERVANGVYFYTLTAGDFAATRKMLILK